MFNEQLIHRQVDEILATSEAAQLKAERIRLLNDGRLAKIRIKGSDVSFLVKYYDEVVPDKKAIEKILNRIKTSQIRGRANGLIGISISGTEIQALEGFVREPHGQVNFEEVGINAYIGQILDTMEEKYVGSLFKSMPRASVGEKLKGAFGLVRRGVAKKVAW